jgi:hypothetical protein
VIVVKHSEEIYSKTMKELEVLNKIYKKKFIKFAGYDPDMKPKHVLNKEEQKQRYAKNLAFWIANSQPMTFFSYIDTKKMVEHKYVALGRQHSHELIEMTFGEKDKKEVYDIAHSMLNN